MGFREWHSNLNEPQKGVFLALIIWSSYPILYNISFILVLLGMPWPFSVGLNPPENYFPWSIDHWWVYVIVLMLLLGNRDNKKKTKKIKKKK